MSLSKPTHQPIILQPTKANEIFNPRFINVDDHIRSSHYDRTPYESVDELGIEVKLYNFGNDIIYVGHRDGSVSTLRPTPTYELVGKLSYFNGYENNTNVRKYNRRNNKKKRDYLRVPEIKEGIYISVTKKISSGSIMDNKGISTLLSHKEGKPVLGKDVDFLINEDHTKQNKSTVNPYSDDHDAAYRLMEEIEYMGPTYFDFEEERVGISHPSNTDLNSMKEYRNRNRHIEMTCIEYFVPIKDIKDAREGFVYIDEVDLCLGTRIRPEDIIHPYSKEGMNKYLLVNGLDTIRSTIKDNAVGILLVNVDNSPQKFVKSYFVNLGGSIIEVKPITDHNVDSGLYLFMKGFKKSENEDAIHEELYIPHDKVIDFKMEHIPRIYRSYPEAVALGDLEELWKEKEREREAQRKEERDKREAERQEQIRQMEIEYKKQLNELEMDMKRKQQEYDDAKAELDRQKQETKNYYEERSYQRKDDSESMKFWMTAGSIALGIFAGVLLKK